MKYSKYKYFFNAIHYSLWVNDIRIGKIIGRVVNVLLSHISKYLFLQEYIKNYNEKLEKEQEKTENVFYNKKTGYHIGWANHWFGYFYSGYSLFFSFILGGFSIREYNHLSIELKILIFAVPIGVLYIPAYKAIYAQNRYLKYFKKFEKEDEHWHKKWKWITFAFCIGSIIATFLGICAAFAIAIVQ